MPNPMAEQATPTPAPMPAASFLLSSSGSESVSDDAASVGVLVGVLVGPVEPDAAGVDVAEGVAEDDDACNGFVM